MKKLILATLAASVALSGAAAPIFRNPFPVPAGGPSSHLWTADFNGDQHPDVLNVDFYTGRLFVLLNTGTGPFAPPVMTQLVATQALPAIGDVNGDGRADLVVASSADGTFRAMLGNGDGTFTPGSSFSTLAFPRYLALGDFNGDQRLDVAIGSGTSHEVAMHFGDGASSFSTGPATTSLDGPSGSMTVADLNGDGKADLMARSVLLGNGNGTFVVGGPGPGGGPELAIHDFNHDGKLDLAVTSGQIHDQYLAVSLGNGNGTFAPRVLYPVGYGADSIASSDLDGDGNADLLVASSGPGAVSVVRGKADGTFHPFELFLSGLGARQIVTGDFDRDGKTDFLTLDSDDVRALSFVRGNGDGTFATYRAFQTGSAVSSAGLGARGGVIADMNEDDKPDVVLLQAHPNAQSYDLAVMLGDGAGKLSAPILTEVQPTWNNWTPFFAAGDVDNDQKVDAVFVSGDYTPAGTTLLGNGAGGFGAPIPLDMTISGRPVLGHFNADSNLDLFVAGYPAAQTFLGNGNGTFGAGIQAFGQSMQLLTGDLNGDGKLDFVAADSYGPIRSCLNDGSAHFACSDIGENYEGTITTLADFSGDGKVDLLFTATNGTRMRLGNGDGTFAAGGVFQISPAPYVDRALTSTGDVDGDGKLDFVFGSDVYLGNADGTFRSRARFRTSNNMGKVAVGDMDGSGSPDLVLTKSSNDVAVLLTRTTADPTAPSSISLTADTTDPRYAQRITFTATVTGGTAVMLGMVHFSVDGLGAALIAVDADGKATFATAFPLGSHVVTATYTGDENYLESAASVTLDVTKAPTSISLSGSPNPTPRGTTVTIRASLSAVGAVGLPVATGAITLRDGDTPLNPLVNGRLQINTLSVGTHVIHADYAGDANYLPSTASYTQEITKPVPTLALQMTPADNFIAGAPVTMRISFPNGAAAGTVSFFVDDVLIATQPIQSGFAEVQTSFTWGLHTLRFHYSGDDFWAANQRTQSISVSNGAWGAVPAIRASATAGGSLQVTWSPILGASSYTVWRKTSLSDPWQSVHSSSGTHLSTTIPAATTWLFAVTAYHSNGSVSPMSAPDLATSVAFADPSLTAGVTPIRAQHLVDLRTAVGSVRTFAALPAYSYTNSILAGQPIRAIDVQQLRFALAEARSAIGLAAVAFSDGTLTSGASIVRKAHVLELRAGVD